MKKFARIFVILILVASVATVLVNYYPYIFARTVEGEVVGVERVAIPVAMMNLPADQRVNSEVFSFAVAIRDKRSGEIVTASSEDRRWAVVEKGKCAEARYFPYPPWRIDKSGTYFNVRLMKLQDCPAGSAGTSN